MEFVVDEKQSKRLIVLITDCMVNDRELAHAIHWMAFDENLPVLYLVLVHDNENMVAAARDMATMKAVTAANRLLVEAKLIGTGHWLETLRETAEPGDVIVCQEEQTVGSGLFKTIPISPFLSSQLNSPVRTISGYYHPIQTKTKNWFHQFFAVLGFLVILSLFTWLQIRVNGVLDGTEAKIFLTLTFCIEMSAIWAWNKFTYR